VSAPIHFPSVQESDGPLVQETQNLGVIGFSFRHSSHPIPPVLVNGNLLELEISQIIAWDRLRLLSSTGLHGWFHHTTTAAFHNNFLSTLILKVSLVNVPAVARSIHLAAVHQGDAPLVQETHHCLLIGSHFCHSRHPTRVPNRNL